MLSSTEHEILNAHKYENIKKFSYFFFFSSDKPRMLFFLLMDVKMPTVVGILSFMSRKISCSSELSMKKMYNLRARKQSELNEMHLLPAIMGTINSEQHHYDVLFYHLHMTAACFVIYFSF